MKTRQKRYGTGYSLQVSSLKKMDALHNVTQLKKSTIVDLLIQDTTPSKIKRLVAKLNKPKTEK